MNTPESIKSRDGNLNGCLGKDCPEACCNSKKMRGLDNKIHEYNTILTWADEYYIKQLGRSDLTIEHVDTIDESPYNMGTAITQRALSGCLSATGCTLNGMKPKSCIDYPFNTNLDNGKPILDIKYCPSAITIGADEENVKRILETRKQRGKGDNKDFIKELIDVLSSKGIEPDWEFINDTVYMEAIS